MKIFECIYRTGQKLTNQGVLPLAISNIHPERRELQAYIEVYKHKLHQSSAKVGIFSPKFGVKTKISVSAFRDFCAQHPTHNVCHINPFPHLRYWSYNVWEHGESTHPGLLEKAQSLLDAAGISIRLNSTPRHGENLLAYCNFWVADELFWEQYVGGVLVPISNFLDAEPNHPASLGILSATQHTQPAPMLPFMIERLYSTWISLHSNLNIAAYPISLDEILEKYSENDFNRILIGQMHDMVDKCDALGIFPNEVRQRISDMCILQRRHMLDYYEQKPHPHTGQPIQILK